MKRVSTREFSACQITADRTIQSLVREAIRKCQSQWTRTFIERRRQVVVEHCKSYLRYKYLDLYLNGNGMKVCLAIPCQRASINVLND